ncbi:MAG: hypothetical protein U9P38_06375, partial [Campylobacterota bacterium]|nr:hypothetical protein [Campylobacterota bacterium]
DIDASEDKDTTPEKPATKPKRKMKVSGADDLEETPKPKRKMKVSGADDLEETPKPKRKMKVSGADDLPDTPIEKVEGYKADVLLAKKSAFESKIVIKALNELQKSYESVSSKENLEELIKINNYKTVIFDKDYTDLDIAEFSSMVKDLNDTKEFKSKLVLLNKPSAEIDTDDNNLVDEVINEKVSKELLASVFEKLS